MVPMITGGDLDNIMVIHIDGNGHLPPPPPQLLATTGYTISPFYCPFLFPLPNELTPCLFLHCSREPDTTHDD